MRVGEKREGIKGGKVYYNGNNGKRGNYYDKRITRAWREMESGIWACGMIFGCIVEIVE
jgi:hypothetical protein